MLLGIVNELQYKLYYRSPLSVFFKLLINERNLLSTIKISLKAWKERKPLKSGKRDGSSKHRTEETIIREFKNLKNK